MRPPPVRRSAGALVRAPVPTKCASKLGMGSVHTVGLASSCLVVTGIRPPSAERGHRVPATGGATRRRSSPVTQLGSGAHTGVCGRKETLVPLQGPQPHEEHPQVPDDEAAVKAAPHVQAGPPTAPPAV